MITIFEERKQLQFVSRGTFITACENGLVSDCIVISVNDSDADAKEITNLVDKCCDNVDVSAYVFPDEDIPLNESDAMGIVEFAVTANNRPIIVHCFAGISRSGAIAKFLNEYLGIDDWFINSYSNYNKAVYNSLAAYTGTSLASYFATLEMEQRHDSWFTN